VRGPGGCAPARALIEGKKEKEKKNSIVKKRGISLLGLFGPFFNRKNIGNARKGSNTKSSFVAWVWLTGGGKKEKKKGAIHHFFGGRRGRKKKKKKRRIHFFVFRVSFRKEGGKGGKNQKIGGRKKKAPLLSPAKKKRGKKKVILLPQSLIQKVGR